MGTVRIPLTQGKFALIDEEDESLVAPFKWHVHSRSYAATADWADRTVILMHRIILDLPPGVPTDHANGNGFDNRRANLRACTHAENAFNARMCRNNHSGYKGVQWDKFRDKWKAIIYVNRQRIHLGRYDQAEEAAQAYDRAARCYFGAFACVNFPEAGERGAREAR